MKGNDVMNYTKLTKIELVAKLEQMTEDFENERKRADELVDRLESLEKEFEEYQDEHRVSNDELEWDYIHKDYVDQEGLDLLTELRGAKQGMEFSEFEKERFNELLEEI